MRRRTAEKPVATCVRLAGGSSEVAREVDRRGALKLAWGVISISSVINYLVNCSPLCSRGLSGRVSFRPLCLE